MPSELLQINEFERGFSSSFGQQRMKNVQNSLLWNITKKQAEAMKFLAKLA